MTSRRPKRAYKDVAIAPAGDAYTILLDRRSAKVGSVALQLPTPALAEAVAQEWREQKQQHCPEPPGPPVIVKQLGP